MGRMRLLFVTSTLAIGGAERMWATLIPELAERGFGVRVVTLVEEGAFFHQLRERGIDVSCAHMGRRTDLGGLRRAFRALDGGVDLVVSQSVNAQTVGVMMAAKAGVPHVTIDQAGPGLSLRFHQRLLMRAVALSVDRLVAVSPLQFERLLPLGFRPERITVIPNSVAEQKPTEPRWKTRERLGVAPDEVVALLVADLRPVKDAGAFVDAVALAHADEPRLKGFVAGTGPELPTVAAAATRAGGTVELLGVRSDVADLMNAADVVCLTSRTEGQPLALLEAMSLGKPIVSTAVGGVTELVVDGETGILVPPQDEAALVSSLLRLAGDSALRRRLGEAGRARQKERFSVDAAASAYIETFLEVIERHGAQGR